MTGVKALIPLEDEEGLALFSWARNARWRGIPLSDLLIFIPNGAHLAGSARLRAFQMTRMKQQGLQPGVSDYLLPVPIRQHLTPGLWLELKRQKGSQISMEQRRFQERMRVLGWHACIVRGAEDAKATIKQYLALSGHEVSLAYEKRMPGGELQWPL